ncbi:PilX N-terminal [Trichlorobacter thiogenes]|uniref:PilX N-terminal n=1 Tax=Trichlorobacter thiogenes TaxID=115783 RepID=A0A1T4SAP7_9BACT|nr:PilX N-terminal domain-containing pilus assembly protein [Trichlorobacter thiogenes]SKA25324.1 PilX N-terminal [Trichlorobacter thiogenes]
MCCKIKYNFTRKLKCRAGASLQNEQGVILVVVLMMLLLLSILGATVLTSTTSELRIAGNFRNTQEAFYNSDGSIDFLVANASSLLTGTDSALVTTTIAVGAGVPSDLTTQFLYTGSGGLESGNSQDVKTYLYSVTMVGHSPNAGEVTIETEIGKVNYGGGGGNVLYN